MRTKISTHLFLGLSLIATTSNMLGMKKFSRDLKKGTKAYFAPVSDCGQNCLQCGQDCLAPLKWFISAVAEDIDLLSYGKKYLISTIKKNHEEKEEAKEKFYITLNMKKIYQNERILIRESKFKDEEDEIDIFDYISDSQLNKERIKLEKITIKSAQLLNYNKTLCIIDEDFFIHLFCMETGKKLNNGKPIQIKRRYSIPKIEIIDDNILHIQYTNHIYLFKIDTGDRINKKRFDISKCKNVCGIDIIDDKYLYIESLLYDKDVNPKQIHIFDMHAGGDPINKKAIRVDFGRIIALNIFSFYPETQNCSELLEESSSTNSESSEMQDHRNREIEIEIEEEESEDEEEDILETSAETSSVSSSKSEPKAPVEQQKKEQNIQKKVVLYLEYSDHITFFNIHTGEKEHEQKIWLERNICPTYGFTELKWVTE